MLFDGDWRRGDQGRAAWGVDRAAYRRNLPQNPIRTPDDRYPNLDPVWVYHANGTNVMKQIALTSLRCVIIVAGFGILVAFAAPTQAAEWPANQREMGPAAPAQQTAPLTDTVRDRLAAAFAQPGPASVRPGLSISSVEVAGQVVTAVLTLPESALYPPDRRTVIDSDGITRQAIDALLGLPVLSIHVLAADPRAPGQPPKPLNAFVPTRPIQTKPALSSVEGAPVPGESGTPPSAPNRVQAGGLAGKSVYLSAGHGWYFHPDLGWKTQRGAYNGIIEDHNNAESVNQYLIAYLRQAGADVFPARDPAMVQAELIVDNGAGYSESGGLFLSGIYTRSYGGSYRFVLSVASGTATAASTWSAPVSVSGWYPVYAWYVSAVTNVPDARYRITHAGGSSDVIINQRTHGYTWRYLGTFYFRAGSTATVTLSNASSVVGMAVVADAIRLGGGIGNIDRGAGPSQKPRWEEASRYWTMQLGAPASVYDSRPGELWCDSTAPDACDDINARPRYADWENIGTGDDAVFVSWHSNGGGGNARGTVSYVYNNDPNPPYNEWLRVPGALELQSAVHNRVIQAIRAGWDPTWYDFGKWQGNLGEVRETRSVPAMLIEMAFHDNITDAAQLREPRFAQLLARAVYQGIVNYYSQKDGVTARYLPEPPERLMVRNVGNRALSVSWQAPATFAFGTSTDPAQSYRVYLSSDGFAWDNGRVVSGTSVTLNGFAWGQVVYARVTAVNAGGESFPTPVLAARVGTAPRVLIVHGFDSLDASMRLLEGAATRMILDRMNRGNYIVQHAAVITEPFDSAVRQAVNADAITLAGYRLVDWYAGAQSTGDGVLTAAERQALRQFVAGAGRVLLVSGSNVAAHLGSADAAFLAEVLGATYVGDGSASYQASAVSPGLFSGLAALGIDDGTQGAYNAWSNDVVQPATGASSVLSYGSGGVAGVSKPHASGALSVYLAFPLETVYSSPARQSVMARVLALVGPPTAPYSPKAFLPAVRGGSLAACNVIDNGGFETATGWQINPTPWPANYTTALVYSGARAMRTGIPLNVTDPMTLAFSSVSQTVVLPPGSPSLSLWINSATEDSNDAFYVRLWDAGGALATLYDTSAPSGGWQQLVFDMTAWAGQRITLLIGARNDGDGLRSVAYYDEVSVVGPCGRR